MFGFRPVTFQKRRPSNPNAQVVANRYGPGHDGLPVSFEQSRFEICRWVSSTEKGELDKFVAAFPASIAADLDGAPVFMASSAFNLRYEQERWPKIAFTDVKDYQKAAA